MNFYLLLIFLFSFNTYSQYKVPCLHKNTKLDLSCSCKRTKTCYTTLRKIDKKIYKSGPQSKMDMKLTKLVLRANKAENALYSGKIGPKDKQFIELDKLNFKLGKARRKRVKKYEAFLKKKGAKVWRMKDRISYANKKLIEQIPLDKRNKLIKSGFQSSFSKFLAKNTGMKGFIPYKTDLKNGVIIAEVKSADELSIDSSYQKITKSSDRSSYKIDRTSLDKANRKNFKYDTIIKKPDSSIFKIISNRYSLISDRLDQKAVTRSLNGAKKSEILNSFQSLLNKG